MSFFLDTNIVVFCLRGRSASAMRMIHSVQSSEILLPLQVHAELLVVVAKSADPTRSNARLTAFIASFKVVWPDDQVEAEYVAIRTQLEKQGTRISEADLWIAATARASAGTLVTNNSREFARVPNLAIADWT